ncbi:MAG: InlB B-repeat-containing protein [Candidatus Aenigmatarchaeota archaeon]
MEARLIRIIAFAIAAIILFGSLSIWAVSTQESAIADVGEIFEVEIQGNEDVDGILKPTSGTSGNIEEDKHLFDVMMHEDYPRESITGSLHLYDAGKVEEHLNSLTVEFEADGEIIGNLTLSNGRFSFQIDKGTSWDQISVNTTGRGSYTRKPGADQFDLHFMLQIDEVQEGVVSEEDITSQMVELDISSTEGGNVTEPGEGTFEYEKGSVVDLEAVAGENSPFIEWTGDNSTIDDTTANQTSIEMLDNYTIMAAFDVVTYDLTIDSTEGGSEIQPGEGTYTYDEGEIVDLEAVADEGYQFVEWTGDNTTIDDTTANQTTIEMLDNYTITAEFELVSYELNLDSTSGGNVTEPGEGSFTYQHGTIVDLEAIADNNSAFLEWSGDNSTIDNATANQTTIEMLDNYTVTAVFDVETYDLTIDSTENGSVVEPGEGTYTYGAGEIIGLEAVPDEGYQFVEWTGDNTTIDDTTANQTTIEMLDNYSITAEFAPITYQLTIDSTEGGNATEPGEGTFEYQYGTVVDLEAIADENYTFIEWTGDNQTIDDTTANQTTIEMLGNYSITAEFLQEPFFDVNIIDYDDPVIEGDTLVVDYTVTNTGDIEDTQDIEFTVEDQDGNIVRSVTDQDITLGPGDVYDQTFSWTTEEGDAGEYDATVSTEDDEEVVPVRVYGSAMEYNDNTTTYTGAPDQWDTHWEATNVYVEGLDQMDLVCNYTLNGNQGAGPNVEAGVRILVNGNTVMEDTTFGQVSENWTGTADVQGQTEVDIQFQYYTENQGNTDSEVTIHCAGYEYVDTTTINTITGTEDNTLLENEDPSISTLGKSKEVQKIDEAFVFTDGSNDGGVIDVHLH